MTTALGNTLSLSYDTLRRLSSVSLGSLSRQYLYRDISDTQTTTQVATVRYPIAGTSLNYDFNYTYDALGNVTGRTAPRWIMGLKQYINPPERTRRILMDTYLYYSYLKFRHDNQKPVCVIMKSIPWWVWVLLVTSLAELGIGAALSQTDAPKMWYKVAMILSICSLGLLNVGIEYIQIADGDKRYKNYWTRIKGVQDFLLQKGISSQEDVTEIKSRAEQRLAQRKLELKALRESDEKWLQTLAAPQRILCKRFSTKSRISRYQCAGWGLIPLGYISPGRLGRYARRMRRECRLSLPGILFQRDQPTFRSANMISN